MTEHDLEIKKKYVQFEDYLKKKDYSDACTLLTNNSKIREYLTKKDLIKVVDYYEKIVKILMNNKINSTKKSIENFHSKSIKTIDFLMDDLRNII